MYEYDDGNLMGNVPTGDRALIFTFCCISRRSVTFCTHTHFIDLRFVDSLVPRITIQQEEFVEMYRQFLVSHFQPAFELLVVLIVYANFASDGYFLETFSVFLLAGGLLWTPVMFNPNALDFTYARSVRPLTTPPGAAMYTAKANY